MLAGQLPGTQLCKAAPRSLPMTPLAGYPKTWGGAVQRQAELQCPRELVGFSTTSPLSHLDDPIPQRLSPGRETPTMANLLKDLLGGGSKSSASPIPSADSGMRTRTQLTS